MTLGQSAKQILDNLENGAFTMKSLVESCVGNEYESELLQRTIVQNRELGGYDEL